MKRHTVSIASGLCKRRMASDLKLLEANHLIAALKPEQVCSLLICRTSLLKRFMDIVGATVGLLLLSPVMLVVAALIWLDSKGPIVFTQARAGMDGKSFTIYKFRTMVVNAEQQLQSVIDPDTLAEPVFKLKQDPRVTTLGRTLRKLSLDELPQLFNVLVGHMSLVGPRPEETWLVERYDDFARQRILVKPGLTGPMQLNGRGDLGLAERVNLETEYMYNYSIWLDVRYVLATIPALVKRKGAY